MKYRLLYFIFLFYNSPIFGLLHRSFLGNGLRIGQKQEHFTFLVFGGFIRFFPALFRLYSNNYVEVFQYLPTSFLPEDGSGIFLSVSVVCRWRTSVR